MLRTEGTEARVQPLQLEMDATPFAVSGRVCDHLFGDKGFPVGFDLAITSDMGAGFMWKMTMKTAATRRRARTKDTFVAWRVESVVVGD